jgi:GTP-binding protein HflX
MIFNKIDAYNPEPWDPDDLINTRTKKNYTLEELETSWVSQSNGKSLFISALQKDNFKKFRIDTYKTIRDIHITRFPYNHFLYPEGLDEY